MGKGTEEDILVLARHLILAEAVRAVEERSFAYQSERKVARDAAMQEYMEHLPKVREILTRERRQWQKIRSLILLFGMMALWR